MVAGVNDYEEIFKVLLEAGADKFLKDKSGKSVLELVEKYKCGKIKRLIEGV